MVRVEATAFRLYHSLWKISHKGLHLHIKVPDNLSWPPTAHQLDDVSLNTRAEERHGSYCASISREQIFGRESQAGSKKADSVFNHSGDICWRDIDPSTPSIESSNVLRGGGAPLPNVQDAKQRALWGYQGVARASVSHQFPPHSVLLCGEIHHAISGFFVGGRQSLEDVKVGGATAEVHIWQNTRIVYGTKVLYD